MEIENNGVLTWFAMSGLIGLKQGFKQLDICSSLLSPSIAKHSI